MRIIYFISLLFFLLGCNSLKHVSTSGIESIAKERYGEAATIVYNVDSTYALVYEGHVPDMKIPVNALNYGIYDVKQSLLIYSEKKYNATVKWVDERYVEVHSSPGVQAKDELINQQMGHYFIDVYTQRKYLQLPN
ncbi:hypothetical protein [Carboxylicivirga taeanensis]|uniref:hypothetical protein n=1 Tax=Carboxylicivirga taeanensis TaxID=1416875 RepID=UPI003F6DDA31